MNSYESRINPRFLAESEKVMLPEPRVIESGRETVKGFKEELIFGHPRFYAVCACIEFFDEVGHFTDLHDGL